MPFRGRLLSLYRRHILLILILFLIVIFFFISLKVGAFKLSWREIFEALLRGGPNGEIVREFRMVRSFGAILVGASLGLAGALLQTILRNPLASPFTLGLSQGAVFGASFAIIILSSGLTHSSGVQGYTIFNYTAVTTCAFLGSILVAALIFALAIYREASPQTIILAGVALSSLCHAGTIFLQYFASDFQVAATVYWTFGDLAKIGPKELKFLYPLVLGGIILVYILRWHFNAFLFSEDEAKTLGVSPKRLRLTVLFITSFLTAVPTSFVGIIGFIGLLSPHLSRLLVGQDQRYFLPFSALLGALLLLVSDILARIILAPKVLPVGIITAFMGAPLFLFLILKRGRL